MAPPVASTLQQRKRAAGCGLVCYRHSDPRQSYTNRDLSYYPWFLSIASSLGAPPNDLLHFLRVRSGTWRHRDKSGTAKPRVAHHYSAGDAHRTDLQSVWSGSKDLQADWRVKLLAVLLLHRSRVTEFVKIPLTEFAFVKV